MDLPTLAGVLGWMAVTALGVAAGVLAVGRLLLWKVADAERWLGVIAPLALGAGFVAGYAMVLPFPRGWTDEPWKMGVFVAGIAGVLLAVVEAIPRRGMWMASRAAVLLLLVGVVTWLTVRRFVPLGVYASAMVGGLMVYMAAAWPAVSERKLWALGPVVMLASGFAATFVTMRWVDLSTQGRMMVMVAALTGLALAMGVLPSMRGVARGATNFLAMMFGVMLVIVTRYRGEDMPWWIFAWFCCGPLAMGLGWGPALRRRPWLCVVLAGVLAAAIVAPAVVVAAKYAPVPYEY
jgi:hypothetical protein